MKEEMKDEQLERAIKDLPSSSPRDSTWDAIEDHLEGEGPNIRKQKWYPFVAAMIVVLMVSGLMLYVRSTKLDMDIQFSEEISLEAEYPVIGFLVDDAFDELLDNECDELSALCEADDFQQLVVQLAELRTEASEMMLLINQAGYDEYLMKAKSRIENENAKVKREIMTLLRG